jgi:hypothetical protein
LIFFDIFGKLIFFNNFWDLFEFHARKSSKVSFGISVSESSNQTFESESTSSSSSFWDLVFSRSYINNSSVNNDSFNLSIDNFIWASKLNSSETSVVLGSFFMIPSNQSFSTVRFELTSLFKIVVKSEESMIVNSHFKSLIINHGPKSILGSFLIINNLTSIFISSKKFNLIFI